MITILCAGSRGDFQPYIALAQALQKQGQRVRIAGFSEYQDLIAGYGIDCSPIEVNYQELGVDDKLLSQAASADNPLKMLFAFQKMKKFGTRIAEQTWAALEGSDLIVYHPGSTFAYFAAHEMGIPAVLATPFPLHNTRESLSVISYGRKSPSSLNTRISYDMLQGMLWMASGFMVRDYWMRRFHRRPAGFGAPYERVSAREPALVCCSNHVFPRPRDWDENIHQYGYWFTEEPSEYVPPKEVTDFLRRGSKPIYFGFGSVFNPGDAAGIIASIKDALAKTNQRGIICGMGMPDGLPETMLAVGSMPHSWLFPQCAAVCHHGGAGTTAAGFRAGVPSIIVPFSNDQFAWAHRAFDLGVGAEPVYRKVLSSERLALAIESSLRGGTVANAKALGEHISMEDGAAACARVLCDIG